MKKRDAATPRQNATDRPRRTVPLAMLLAAGVLTGAFFACHAAGLGQGVSSLYGTLQTPEYDIPPPPVLPLVYVLLHFAFVLLVPALLLGAVFQVMLETMAARLADRASTQTSAVERTDDADVPGENTLDPVTVRPAARQE